MRVLRGGLTGHRSTAVQSLPLRRGMLHYAYSRQMPVQIVITAGKEAVISEKDMAAHFGQTLLVGYSEVLHPKVGGAFLHHSVVAQCHDADVPHRFANVLCYPCAQCGACTRHGKNAVEH